MQTKLQASQKTVLDVTILTGSTPRHTQKEREGYVATSTGAVISPINKAGIFFATTPRDIDHTCCIHTTPEYAETGACVLPPVCRWHGVQFKVLPRIFDDSVITDPLTRMRQREEGKQVRGDMRYTGIKKGLTMHNNPNRREFTRVPVQLEAEVTAQQVSSLQGHSRNVSLSGVFLHCNTPLPVGTSCSVTLRLADYCDEMGIAASGRVVRLQDEGMAIMFTEILGLDSFNHLRNLVLSNSIGATEQVEKEFRTHVGIKRWAEYRASVAS